MNVAREEIAFLSGGVRCRGWKFVPPAREAARWHPAVVLAHGFGAVKEMYLDDYAAAFARAGLVAVVFDYRCLGASEGARRGQIRPFDQVEDYRNAITFAQGQPEVDAERIGAWGSSYSGGHVITLAALDPRVRCVVAQVPYTDGWATMSATSGPDALPRLQEMLQRLRAEPDRGGEPVTVPIVAEDGRAALPTPDAHAWFTRAQRERVPDWENRALAESLEWMIAYQPHVYLPHLHTPLLAIVAEADGLAPAVVTRRHLAAMPGPKRLVTLPGGHFDAYNAEFDRSAAAAVEWFRTHLAGGAVERR